MIKDVPTKKSVRFRKAGHRSWGVRGALAPGVHRGDIMSAEKRSVVMARIKGKNTNPETTIFNILNRLEVSFLMHVKDLPGRPDIVFEDAKLTVFLDGDFWHGWRFPLWRHKLSIEWADKIAANRERDKRNFYKLRRLGWKVIRIWEHQIERCPEDCVRRILSFSERNYERR